MKPITREEARRLGLKRYFTGKACPRGHVAERLVSSYGCIPCAALRFASYYEKNATRLNAVSKAYRNENSDRIRGSKRAWEAANKVKKSAYDRESYIRHKAKRRRVAAVYRQLNAEALNASTRRWKASNVARVAATNAARHARKLRAVPGWVDMEEVQSIYEHSRQLTTTTGIRHHVDHIIPLNGRNVCGLHVAANLRAVPAIVNLKKGATWE